MSDVVAKIELSALDVAGNSDALTYFAKSMTKETDEQSTSVIEIESIAKNLHTSMQSIKKNVKSAYDISKSSIKEADNSSLEILSLIQEMNVISQMSDNISTTMNFIDNITEETNLLALNAAIQAAHAGEEGKGFGVVATEIKNLADSSSKATKNIYEIIDKTVDSISKGVIASKKAEKALTKIISFIMSTENLMSKINKCIDSAITSKLSTITSKTSSGLHNTAAVFSAILISYFLTSIL